MAGKLHGDYQRYIYAQPGGTVLAPGRLPIAYAEGYVARRKNALQTTNPHVTNTPAANFWDKGWTDGNNLYPSTHVGGPTPT